MNDFIATGNEAATTVVEAPCGAQRLDEYVRPNPVDRRSAPRHSAVEHRIWLGWWIDRDFQTVAASLLDISRRGAAISSPAGVPVGTEVWFCIVGGQLSAGARAVVVASEAIAGEEARVRGCLRFVAGCPEDLFSIALGLVEDTDAVPLN